MREPHRRSSRLLAHVLRHVRSLGFGGCLATVAALGAVGALTPRAAEASVSVAASLEDLASGSTVIARVTALDRESAWEEGRIVTYSRVRIDEIVAGVTPAGVRELRVRTLGGRVGDIGQLVEGEAVLTPSESSLLFLVPRSQPPQGGAIASMAVVGRAQGQLVVRRDAHGREIVRIGAVGELVDRRVHPPQRPGGPRIALLDGATLESVAASAKRAFEVGHAR